MDKLELNFVNQDFVRHILVSVGIYCGNVIIYWYTNIYKFLVNIYLFQYF